MCSNFQPIKNHHADWLKKQFGCDLPADQWRAETYPTYAAPFIYLKDGQPKCELAQFGLVPHWAPDKKKYGLRTYNARSETVHEKPSYRTAWRERRFGIVPVERFYEPNWETGKAQRWGIFRSDNEPTCIASIWERFVHTDSGEIIFSFSMLTINADDHPIMKHFHKPEDEKRSVAVLNEEQYLPWLNANAKDAREMLQIAPDGFLKSELSLR